MSFGCVLLLATLLPQQHLCTVAELNRLFEGPPSERFYFTLTGDVTFVDKPRTTNEWGSFVLRDQTGRGNFFSNTLPQFPEVGSRVIVTGNACVCNTMEPWMKNLTVTKIGSFSPDEPRSIPLSRLNDSELNLQVIRTTATIIDVFPDDLGSTHDFLLLNDNETIVPAIGIHDQTYKDLIDARVEVSGIVRRSILSERKYLGTCLTVRGPECFKVLTPPPKDIFDLPEIPPNIYIGPRDIIRKGRQTVRGVVLAAWQRDRLLIRTANNQLVGIIMACGESLPPYGSRISASGYPTTDLFRINLMRAKIRVDATNCLKEDIPPQTDLKFLPIQHDTSSQRFDNKNFGRLVTLRGVVRTLPLLQNEDYQFILDCNAAHFVIDFSANQTAADGVQLNCEIEVTGRCVPEITQWQPSDALPRITGARVVIRKPNDIRIISNPPWLTVRKLLVIVGVLLLGLIGLCTQSLIRKRYNRLKLKERNQLAVELHDSLSQALTGLACKITIAAQDPDLSSTRSKIAAASRILQSCRTELRNCLFDLRTDLMSETSLDKAIRRAILPFETHAEILIRFNVKSNLCDYATVHAVIATIRELTANAIRHGHAWTVRIAGTVHRGTLYFSVIDDGCGFDTSKRLASEDGHFGLDGIVERINRLSGTSKLISRQHRGTKVKIQIPLENRK